MITADLKVNAESIEKEIENVKTADELGGQMRMWMNKEKYLEVLTLALGALRVKERAEKIIAVEPPNPEPWQAVLEIITGGLK